jgi:hypothetical protein
VSGFSKQYGVEVDNVIIIVMQNLFSEVATFHVTEFLADGGGVTRDYSVTPGTAHEEAEKVKNEDIYKVRIIQYPGVRHYDTIVSLPKNDKRAGNHSAYYYQASLQRTCTLESGRFGVRYSKVSEVNGLRRGRGLYAKVTLKKGSVIGWYPCTPFTYYSGSNQEGESNAIGTYRFVMADGGPDYDNYPESLKISKEENSETGYCDLLNEDANTMGLAWLINTDVPKCNTKHEEKLSFNPDEINSETLLKVRVVFAAEDIEPHTELTIRYDLGGVSARTQSENIAREKHRHRSGGKGYETPDMEENGEVREEKEEEKGASTTVSGSGVQVGDTFPKRSCRVTEMALAQQMKDKKKADAEVERQHELKVKEEKDADNKKRKKEAESKKEEEKAEKEAKKMKTENPTNTKAEPKKRARASVDNVDLIEPSKHDTTVMRVVGIPTTVIHTVPPHALQIKCNNLEILNTDQMKTIQELTDELEKRNVKIVALVALQETQKIEFEKQLLKEKVELTTQLLEKGKLDAATQALVDVEANRKLETGKNERIMKLEVQLHGYRVSNYINERPLTDHANDQRFEQRLKRLQQMKALGLTLDDVKYLETETSQPCQSQSVLNNLASTIVESAMSFPESHAIQPLEQNALLAIQQTAVFAIEERAPL